MEAAAPTPAALEATPLPATVEIVHGAKAGVGVGEGEGVGVDDGEGAMVLVAVPVRVPVGVGVPVALCPCTAESSRAMKTTRHCSQAGSLGEGKVVARAAGRALTREPVQGSAGR